MSSGLIESPASFPEKNKKGQEASNRRSWPSVFRSAANNMLLLNYVYVSTSSETLQGTETNLQSGNFRQGGSYDIHMFLGVIEVNSETHIAPTHRRIYFVFAQNIGNLVVLVRRIIDTNDTRMILGLRKIAPLCYEKRPGNEYSSIPGLQSPDQPCFALQPKLFKTVESAQ